MSKENVKQMFGKLGNDAALKEKYAELMQAHQKESENKIAETIIKLGKTSGFEFSKEDFWVALSEDRELSDGILAKVNGGSSEVRITYINRSNDPNHSKIIVF